MERLPQQFFAALLWGNYLEFVLKHQRGVAMYQTPGGRN